MRSNPTEYLRAEDTFSPQLHRLDQATRFRAVHETDTIPPPSEYLTMYTHPPPRLMQRSKLHLDQLSKIADIKKGSHLFDSSPPTLTNLLCQSHLKQVPGSCIVRRNSTSNLDQDLTFQRCWQSGQVCRRLRYPRTTPFRHSSRFWRLHTTSKPCEML